ncbi:MAG: transketolase [Lentisphaerae bacterium]|nr:transketolase [Lentisphaerota bacterium]
MDQRSKEQRRAILQVLERARRGHIGSTFSILEIVRVLYEGILRVDPRNPQWPERDRFILSKGHGCLALYLLLAEKGFFPRAELSRFCQFEGILGGHPEYGKVPGVEASTGALGHGFSIGVGMALAARMDRKAWRVFVLVGDGECNEGSIWEAALSAGKHKLDALTVIVDYNKMQSYGSTFEIQDLEPFMDKWRSFGFAVREVPGHDVAALEKVFRALPVEPGKPSAVIAHTVKGCGMPAMENNPEWHHKSKISDEEFAQLYAELGLGRKLNEQ